MRRVKGKDTLPEMRVRRVAHALGYRFRLHPCDLPGKPDLVFRKHHVVVFVHGCFWHRHPGCKKAGMPKSKTEFWEAKFNRNVCRDRENVAELERMGWKVRVLWECETKDPNHLPELIAAALEASK
ncbi:very short patch repair endonuclease [Mesorhizobium sp. M0871]